MTVPQRHKRAVCCCILDLYPINAFYIYPLKTKFLNQTFEVYAETSCLFLKKGRNLQSLLSTRP